MRARFGMLGGLSRGIRPARAAGPRPRRRRSLGIAGATALVASALVAQGGITTNASWTDGEWAHAPAVGTANCADPTGGFIARGEGRALSGSLLGIDLDTLAEARGVSVENDGSLASPTPIDANPVPGVDSAWADPLDVTALSAVDVNLGRGLLKLPLDSRTGVLGQYAQAKDTGQAAGASGYVTETGGIGLDPGTGYPDLASLSLSDLLASVNPAVAGTLQDVTDVSLRTGAVAGRAQIDGCAQAWAPGTADPAAALAGSVAREYLAASVRTDVTSPTVGALVSQVNSRLGTLQGTLDGLLSNTGVTSSIANAVSALLSGLLGTLNLGGVSVTQLSASIDLAPVRSLLSQPFGDDHGVVTIDPAHGVISVDTAALLAQAYGTTDGHSLNGLAPNTDLLSDPAILTALTGTLGSVLSSWLDRIESTLRAQLDAITVNAGVKVTVRLLVVPVAEISASVRGSLGDLLTGTVQAQASAKILGSIELGILNGLLGALTGGLGKAVGDAVGAVLTLFRTLPSTITALTAPILTAVSNVYTKLFLSNVVSLLVNAQNDPFSGSAEPPDWASIPGGRYDVAALRVGVLGALSQNDVRLYLGRASVGPACSVAAAALGSCAGG